MSTSTSGSGSERLAVGAALVTVVLWASAFVGIRAAAVDLLPGSIALGRLVVGTLALGMLVGTRPWVRPRGRDLLCIAGTGLSWFAAYSVVLGEAERRLDAGTAAMVVGVGPLLIALLAATLLGEGFSTRLLAGCGVALVGTALIGLASATAPATGSTVGQAASAAAGPLAGATPAGLGLALGAALLYAVGVVCQKPALRRLPPLQVTWLACLIGALACLPYAPGLLADLGRARPEHLGWIIYLGLVPTSVGFSTWGFALARLSAGRAGAMTYLIAPATILISWLVLGETPSAVATLGGAVCIVGVAFARGARLPRPPSPSATIVPVDRPHEHGPTHARLGGPLSGR